MALQESGVAPYAPTKAVVSALDAHRDTGLVVNVQNLARLGVTDSIVSRTLQAFKLLDLLTEQGEPTQALRDFKQAPSDSYKEVLAETLRAAYAPIFAVTGPDPSTKSAEQIGDAFRTYSPDSLRDRMVSLFLGLCAYAGIISEPFGRKPGPRSGRPAPRVAPRKSTSEQPPVLDGVPRTTGGGSNTVALRSSGTVTVSYSADLWNLSPEDREFLFGLIDKVKAYEAQRQLTAAPTTSEVEP